MIAYEPVWAIGTGEVATPEDAQEVCGAIRACESPQTHGADVGAAVRILYGGSVKADSAPASWLSPTSTVRWSVVRACRLRSSSASCAIGSSEVDSSDTLHPGGSGHGPLPDSWHPMRILVASRHRREEILGVMSAVEIGLLVVVNIMSLALIAWCCCTRARVAGCPTCSAAAFDLARWLERRRAQPRPHDHRLRARLVRLHRWSACC